MKLPTLAHIVASGVLSLTAWAQAQTPAALPDTMTFVVPYRAGGAADFIGRELAAGLEAHYDTNISVQNKPGAGGTIGSLSVSKSPADGKTWVLCGLGSHVVGPLMRDVGYDPQQDFSVAAIVGGPASALISNTDSGIDALSSLQNKKWTWASPGVGTHGHLLGALLSNERNLVSNHIPFKGGAEAVQAVMGGHTQAGVATITSIGGASDSPLMRVLAVSSSKRSPLLPNTPTFAELGMPQVTSLTWFGVCGPKGVGETELNAMQAAIQAVLAKPDWQARFAQRGVELLALSSSQGMAYMAAERQRWHPVVAATQK